MLFINLCTSFACLRNPYESILFEGLVRKLKKNCAITHKMFRITALSRVMFLESITLCSELFFDLFRMTKTSGRLREKRPQVASHFRVSDVKMKALNDPLPPHHPGSPPDECGGNDKKREFRYYSLDLSKLQRKTEQQHHHQRPTTPSNTINPMTWAEKNEDLYPSVSNGNINLLISIKSPC